jgi:hypothetical protein
MYVLIEDEEQTNYSRSCYEKNVEISFSYYCHIKQSNERTHPSKLRVYHCNKNVSNKAPSSLILLRQWTCNIKISF